MHAPAIQEAPLSVKDLFQARFLSRLFAQNVGHATERMVLKGGMAMRVAHQSCRHTKDIDLDADSELSLGAVQSSVRRAIKDATGGGWLDHVQISEPKQTATTARWKIQGTVPKSQVVLHLTVEVSFRHHLEAHEVRQVALPSATPGLPESRLPVYTDEMLLLNKVEALLSPMRDAPRDVVDLYLLFQGEVELAPRTLAARLGTSRSPVELIRQMWTKLEGMDEARFQAEVAPNWDNIETLPSAIDWTNMRLLVAERLEALLATLDTDTTAPAPSPAPAGHVTHRHRGHP
jgi:predicted nucleotidyltransferase component of viral defense system